MNPQPKALKRQARVNGPALVFPTPRPRLLLRPAAFLKLTYLCQAASTEIGGFGLSSAADPLVLEDVLIVRQRTSIVTVAFDDEAVADLVDRMADAGVPPCRCSRVWVHTHPADSAVPSHTDEQTFARSFGGQDWSVMLILARGGAFYARLQMTNGLKAAVEIPVSVDWPSMPVWLETAALPELVRGWRSELDQLIEPEAPIAWDDEGVSRGLRFEGLHGADEMTQEELDWRDFIELEEEMPLHDDGQEGQEVADV
jgi:hypothetical protein